MAIINSILNNLTDKAYFYEKEADKKMREHLEKEQQKQAEMMSKLEQESDKDFFDREMGVLKNVLMKAEFLRLAEGAKNPIDPINTKDTLTYHNRTYHYNYFNAIYFMGHGEPFDAFVQYRENSDEDLYNFLNVLNDYFDENFYKLRTDDEEAHYYKVKKSKRNNRRAYMHKDKAKHGLPKYYSKWCKGKVYFSGDKYNYERNNWVKLEMGAI